MEIKIKEERPLSDLKRLHTTDFLKKRLKCKVKPNATCMTDFKVGHRANANSNSMFVVLRERQNVLSK